MSSCDVIISPYDVIRQLCTAFHLKYLKFRAETMIYTKVVLIVQNVLFGCIWKNNNKLLVKTDR